MDIISTYDDASKTWKSIPALTGKKGDNGDDYVLTAQDKIDIANIVLQSLSMANKEEF